MKTNSATQWLDGEISMGKMLELEGVPHAQGAQLVGAIWQAIRQKAYALDAKLEDHAKIAMQFAEEAKHDNTRTVISDVTHEALRARAIQEMRSLLRFHLLGCIDNTGAAGAP